MKTLYRDYTTGKTGMHRCCAILLLLAFMFTITSCSNDDTADSNEPSPATVRLVFLPALGQQMRAISESNEKSIRDLSVFIFDNTGVCIGYSYQLINVADASSGIVVNIKTHEANNCTLYAIANIAETETDFNTQFADKTTKSAIDNNLTQTISAAKDLGNGDYLPMFGRTVSTINIQRQTGAQDIGKIEMEHVCSKIKLNIVPKAGSNITITGYQLHHVPLSTYISDQKGYYEKATWAAPAPGSYGDFDAVTGLSTAEATVTNTYYMYENMVGTGTSTTEKERYATKAATDASYLTVTAQTQAWKSTYTVYLGTVDVTKSIATNGTLTYPTITTDQYNNYDVYRNGQYTVTVKIDGSGVTDTRVDYKPTTIIYTITLDGWNAVTNTGITF